MNSSAETDQAMTTQCIIVRDVGKAGDGKSFDSIWLGRIEKVGSLFLGEEDLEGLGTGVVLEQPSDQ